MMKSGAIVDCEDSPSPKRSGKDRFMRLTRRKYENSKKVVEKAKAHLQTVKKWEEAMKQVGDVGNQRIIAIKFNDKNGSMTTECEMVTTPELKVANPKRA